MYTLLLSSGHESLPTIFCDGSNWLQSPTHFIASCPVPCVHCLLSWPSFLDVSLNFSLGLRQSIYKMSMWPLRCSPVTYSVPWGSHIASENHTLCAHVHNLWITSASRVILLPGPCELCLFGGDCYSIGARFILSDFKKEKMGFVILKLMEWRTF